ncbi:MAG: arsenate reductase ArsC [Deltaproteobacteria bacterium]|nr:arsenate reductase ArsC [Deltaproteobacteria bacterium]
MSCRVYGASGLPPRWLLEAAILRAAPPQHLLFLCVANSARSQLAEGLARAMAPEGVSVYSAGSEPTGVRPEAVTVLEELNIPTNAQRSNSIDALEGIAMDTVITLCAEEVCPTWLQPVSPPSGRGASSARQQTVRRLHWGLPDPAAVDESEEARLNAFRATRDELSRRLRMIWPGQFRRGRE